MRLSEALEALKQGSMIAVFDSDKREGETDLMFHAKFATPEKIETLRKDAGGLICLSVDGSSAEKLGIEFFSDLLEKSGSGMKAMDCKKTAYGDKPAFSIPINSKKVYTGITDIDRALTISEFAKLVEEGADRQRFLCDFYTPGHVFLLIGSGLGKRKGHTELSLKLAEMAGLGGTMVLCEMLGKGRALGKEGAREYCEKRGIIFIEGSEVHD